MNADGMIQKADMGKIEAALSDRMDALIQRVTRAADDSDVLGVADAAETLAMVANLLDLVQQRVPASECVPVLANRGNLRERLCLPEIVRKWLATDG